MLKAHEIRPMSEKEILQRIKDNLEALDKINFQKAIGGEVKNPVQVRFLREEISRMQTILREREIQSLKNSSGNNDGKSKSGSPESEGV